MLKVILYVEYGRLLVYWLFNWRSVIRACALCDTMFMQLLPFHVFCSFLFLNGVLACYKSSFLSKKKKNLWSRPCSGCRKKCVVVEFRWPRKHISVVKLLGQWEYNASVRCRSFILFVFAVVQCSAILYSLEQNCIYTLLYSPKSVDKTWVPLVDQPLENWHKFVISFICVLDLLMKWTSYWVFLWQ